MTKQEAIKLFEEKKVHAMMEYKVSAGNKLKRRLTQRISFLKYSVALPSAKICVNLRFKTCLILRTKKEQQ